MELATAGHDGRRYARVACGASAVIALRDQELRGVCENLSIGGAYFKGAGAPLSTTVSMTLSLPMAGDVELVGEVRHSSDSGCGIRFTRIPSRALLAICAYVNGHA